MSTACVVYETCSSSYDELALGVLNLECILCEGDRERIVEKEDNRRGNKEQEWEVLKGGEE